MRATFPATFSHGAGIAALSAGDAWLAGLDDSVHLFVLHYVNGVVSTTQPTTEQFGEIPSIVAINDNDVWIGSHSYDSGPYVAHWDGHTWTRIANTPRLDGYSTSIQAMAARASDDVWVAATILPPNGLGNPRLAIERWNGHAMQFVAIGPYFVNGGPHDMLEFSPRNVVILNDGLFAHSAQAQVVNWDGTHLHYHVLPVLPGQAKLFDISVQLAATSPANIWAIANGSPVGTNDITARIWRFDGSAWQPYVYDAGNVKPVFAGVAALRPDKTVILALDPIRFAALVLSYENGIRFHREMNDLTEFPTGKIAPVPGTSSFWTVTSNGNRFVTDAALIDCQ